MTPEDLVPISSSDWPANPFPARTRAHKLWTEVSLWIKEHLFLFHAEMLESFPEEGSPEEILRHHLKLLGGSYDIFASAIYTRAAPTDAAARIFEDVLNGFESSVVTDMRNLVSEGIVAEAFCTELIAQLSQRKLYWTGQMLRMVREHKEARRARAISSRKGCPVQPAGPGPVSESPAVEGKATWNEKLRIARQRAGLSRTAASHRLKQFGVQITADAIKKHEEGKAKPKTAVRKGYGSVYGIPENTLFPEEKITREFTR